MFHGKKYFLITAATIALLLPGNAQTDSIAVADSLIQDSIAFPEAMLNEVPSVLPLAEPKMPSAFEKVDIHSYALYNSKQWKELLTYCELSFKGGIDYFYLRMRSGIAAFELGRYRQAVQHFRKALEYDAYSGVAKEYLYYCYLYTDRAEEAAKLSLGFNEELRDKTNTGNKWSVTAVGTESGIKKTRQAGYEDGYYSYLVLSHSLGNKAGLLHAATYYTQREERFNVQQLQYYIRTNIPLKNEMKLTAGLQMIDMLLDKATYSLVTTSSTFQPVNNLGNPVGPPLYGKSSSYQMTYQSTQSVAAVGAVALSKETSWFSVSLGATGALLDTVVQTQLNAGFSFFPLRDNRIIIGANTYLHSEDRYYPDFAYSPFISLSPHPRLLLSASYFKNKGDNISEYNASLVTNSIDYTLQRWFATVSVGLGRGVWIFGTAGIENKKHIAKKFEYSYYNYSGGIKIFLK